jgi:hypothetical protein
MKISHLGMRVKLPSREQIKLFLSQLRMHSHFHFCRVIDSSAPDDKGGLSKRSRSLYRGIDSSAADNNVDCPNQMTEKLLCPNGRVCVCGNTESHFVTRDWDFPANIWP